jgi:Tetratricopeptide repeat
MAEAEAMYMRALQGKEKMWGPEHTSTLDTVNNLGVLYRDQGKTAEAEAMYVRALQGYQKALGTDHPRTQVIIRNLDQCYAQTEQKAWPGPAWKPRWIPYWEYPRAWCRGEE